MLFRVSPETFWNLISTKYAATPIANRTAYEAKMKTLKTFLKPNFRVLDIGCGTGTQCIDIADNVAVVTGIDFSSKLIAIANQRLSDRKLKNVEFIKTSIFDNRLLPESYDVVMAFYFLHLVEDIELIFNRIAYLLKPGGIFISESVCLGDKNKLYAQTLRLIGQVGFLPLMSLLKTEQLEQKLEKANFQLIDKQKFDPSNPEYTLFARKVLYR